MNARSGGHHSGYVVNPEPGGQSFLPPRLAKIKALRSMMGVSGHSIVSAMDDGITPATALMVIADPQPADCSGGAA